MGSPYKIAAPGSVAPQPACGNDYSGLLWQTRFCAIIRIIMTRTSLSKLLPFSLLALLPLTGFAATYKCVEDGHVTYQGTPCKKGTGAAINVVPPDDAAAVAASKGSAEDPAAIAARFDAKSKALAAEHRLRDIDYESKSLEAELAKHQSAKKSGLDALQQKKDYWKTQLGGSTWVQNTDDQMKAVSEKYEAKIQAVQEKLDKLNKEKSELGSQVPRSENSENNEKRPHE